MQVSDILKPKSRAEIITVIDSYLKEFEETHLPNGFQWRKGQKETIVDIFHTYLQKKYKVVMLDAPTGFGKSLAALACSFIFNKINKVGYILTSEISLQKQYEEDIQRFRLPYGVVQGVDHYQCIDNDEKYSLGTCKTRNKDPHKMPCYNKCPYLSARNFAARSDTAILNYNYWLIMQNMSDKTDRSGSIFSKRDFLIADEAHKILDIVQNHYSPRFTEKTTEKLKKITHFFNLHNVNDHKENVETIDKCIKGLYKIENQDSLFLLLKGVRDNLKAFFKSTKVLKEIVAADYPNKKPPKEWRESLFIADWIKDFHCKVGDYCDIIEKTSTRNIVKNPSEDELVFNCLQESYMMHKYFHQFTGFMVLMSATFSDPKEYMRSINIKNVKYIKTENLFNFEKSPIYYYPNKRMSYKFLDQNKEWLYSKINEILDKHKGESGIIHSASYDLAGKIRDNLTPENTKRVFLYNGTEDKINALNMMKLDPGKVVLGPSLLSGISLDDDFCRFIIFPKVPYPSLTDRFTKVKMELNPGWYRWRTILSVLQGAGRGIRSETDFCSTFILDACFGDLLNTNRNSFPPEFLRRIVTLDE
jgi:Rad3-related DNA helicase